MDRQQKGGRAGGRESLVGVKSDSGDWVGVRRCWEGMWRGLAVYTSGVTVESSLSEASGSISIWFKPVAELCSGLLFLMATIMVTGGLKFSW